MIPLLPDEKVRGEGRDVHSLSVERCESFPTVLSPFSCVLSKACSAMAQTSVVDSESRLVASNWET